MIFSNRVLSDLLVDFLTIVSQQFTIHKKALGCLFGVWGLYLGIVFFGALYEKPDGLYTAYPNIGSDWALHIGMANIFAHKAPSEWFAYHPIYADGKFTYGFLVNLISGLLIRAGFSVYWAFILPSLIYAFLLLLGLYSLFYLLLQSKKQSLLAISLFFLSSGLGFFRFLYDFFKVYGTHNFSKFNIYKDYSTANEYSWHTGNVIVGILLPQRAFLLGMTISIWILVGLLYVLQATKNSSSKIIANKNISKKEIAILLLCSIATGLLVITHFHSLIVLAILFSAIALKSYRHSSILGTFYALPSLILVLTLYFIFVYKGIQNPDFISWRPGWTAKGGIVPWLIMWLRLWGLMMPIALMGLLTLQKKSRQTQSFFVGIWGVFLFANLIQMQPTPYPLVADNTQLYGTADFNSEAVVTSAETHQRNRRH